MRPVLFLLAATLACATKADTAAPAPADDTKSGAVPTPPPENAASVGDHCTADAQCPDRPLVHCAGEGGGRCVAADGVGCGFIPDNGEPQVRCCDGGSKCNPDPLAAPAP